MHGDDAARNFPQNYPGVSKRFAILQDFTGVYQFEVIYCLWTILLFFWPMVENTLFDVGHCSCWRILVGTYVCSVIQTELELHRLLQRHYRHTFHTTVTIWEGSHPTLPLTPSKIAPTCNHLHPNCKLKTAAGALFHHELLPA